jgi:hypothetical protein
MCGYERGNRQPGGFCWWNENALLPGSFHRSLAHAALPDLRNVHPNPPAAMTDNDTVTVVFQLVALHPVLYFLVGNLIVTGCGMHLYLPFEFVRVQTCILLFGAIQEILNPKGEYSQEQIIS